MKKSYDGLSRPSRSPIDGPEGPSYFPCAVVRPIDPATKRPDARTSRIHRQRGPPFPVRTRSRLFFPLFPVSRTLLRQRLWLKPPSSHFLRAGNAPPARRRLNRGVVVRHFPDPWNEENAMRPGSPRETNRYPPWYPCRRPVDGRAVRLFRCEDKPADQGPPQEKPGIEVVFCLDTTGSMSGLIAGARRKDLEHRQHDGHVEARP